MNPPQDVEARVRAYVAAHVPSLAHGAPAVLAVSGGGDSIALAAILCEAAIVDPARAVVAHFDHRLRGGAAAARDCAVVRAVCDRYSLQLVTGAWESPLRGEAPARAARYAFLRAAAEQAGAGVVATGHTEDDQVETVMLHMARGGGSYGLAGMEPERAWPQPGGAGLRLARPLLGRRREETRAYCVARGLAFADDETNEDAAFARNRIRRMLAETYGETPEAREVILRTAAMARATVSTLEEAVRKAVPCAQAEGGRALALPRGALRALPEDLAIYAWHPALQRLLGDAREFGRGHFATMARAAAARTGATFQLPRGVVLTVDAAELLLSVGALADERLDPAWEHAPPFDGRAGAWEIVLQEAGGDVAAAAPADKGWLEAVVAAPEDARLRARRPGDRVALADGRGHRKLQDAYIDAKVPRRCRDGAPVLASGRDVLWSPLIRAAPRAGESPSARWRVRWRRHETGPDPGMDELDFVRPGR